MKVYGHRTMDTVVVMFAIGLFEQQSIDGIIVTRLVHSWSTL